jgi:excisionase family DNA binding protein
MSIENLLTLDEVAKLLRLSRTTLYKMLQKGTIPAVRVGFQWRFDEREIESWLKGQQPQVPQPPEPPRKEEATIYTE